VSPSSEESVLLGCNDKSRGRRFAHTEHSVEDAAVALCALRRCGDTGREKKNDSPAFQHGGDRASRAIGQELEAERKKGGVKETLFPCGRKKKENPARVRPQMKFRNGGTTSERGASTRAAQVLVDRLRILGG